MPWRIEQNHPDCTKSRPFGVVKETDGELEGCHPTRMAAEDQLAALYAAEADQELEELALEVAMTATDETLGGKPSVGTPKDRRLRRNRVKSGMPASGGSAGAGAGAVAVMEIAAPADESAGPFRAWSGTLVVEGVETGDGREFAEESLEWADPPLPLSWQIQSQEKHMQSVVVGRIDSLSRVGNEINGSGVIDLGSEHGREYARQLESGLAGGVSVDVDSVKDADVELVFPQQEDGEEDAGLGAIFGPPPEKVVFHRGRIRGATGVALPAFVEARIELEPEGETVTASAILGRAKEERRDVTRPSAWFMDPKLSGPTAWTIHDDDRVFGHLALWNTCHTSFQDRCVMAPREVEYPYFHLGEVRTSDGETVAVGHVSFGTGHAAAMLEAVPAVAHYDDTGHVGADICVGTDSHGIWVAGALRGELDETQIHALRSASLSGDWRKIGRQLRLVAVLAVNVPGFPVPRVHARFNGESLLALTAAGVITEQTMAWRETEGDGTLRIRKRGS